MLADARFPVPFDPLSAAATQSAQRGGLLAAMLRPFAQLPGVFVDEGELATTVTIHKTASLDIVLTIVPEVLEFYVDALDTSTGASIASDWFDYYALDGETPAELRCWLLRDVRAYLCALTSCDLRVGRRLHRRLMPWLAPRTVAVVEARRGSNWARVIPISEDFPWETT